MKKNLRSQGLALSEPVRIGDWGHLDRCCLTALAAPPVTGLVLRDPITLDQPVYLPGNDRQGAWASPLLETVFGPDPKPEREAAQPRDGRLSLKGDLELASFAAGELRRTYANLWAGHDIRDRRAGPGDDPRPRTAAVPADGRLPRSIR
jgi:hypothetical protein